MLYNSVEDCIGNTPIVLLSRFAQASGITSVHIYGKLEKQNPMGSVKDRVALSMIEDAEKSGNLKPNGSIVEPTSGNTGIGLAGIAAVRGYSLTLVLPENMSAERMRLLKAYGARIVTTPAKEGMDGAVRKAEEIAAQTGAFMPSQFENPANPAAHAATAREILSDMPNGFDCLIATVGTGGTVSGIGRVIRKVLPSVHIIAVEPAESPLLSQGQAGSHGIQGIGANFIPQNYDASVVDEVLTIPTQNAYEAARLLAHREGLLCGMSSGAAICAAVIAARRLPDGASVVAILPDTGERYLSTALFPE